ncbi:MAG: FKBP-type peptidyl-prolyl cis-trans isomerase [Alphaproteobacteria bacterium]|nr:FKBP-type peptidyl-prolyl cis-trans isomerase [Alphaproteobacteria bacterium]
MKRILVLAAAAVALSACHPKPSPQAQASQAQAFLAANARKPGVHVLPDGLQYQVLQSGPANGGHPQVGDEVKVNYEGKLTSGTVFDSSYQRGTPAVMPLSGLIPAWQEALPMMRPGDVWMLYVPPKLGYGAQGAGDAIPPNAALIFKIELIDFLPGPGRTANG